MEIVPARSCAPDQLAALFGHSDWPEFIDADVVAGVALPRVRELFADHELALVDEQQVVGAGWGVPVGWNGTKDGLPDGYSQTLRRALHDHDRHRDCNTFVLCAVQVRSDLVRRGLAATVIRGLVDHADAVGMQRVIAPLRPAHKRLYPLTPIDQYQQWRRADGRRFDPWLRLHERLGATVLACAEKSQVFTGTVEEWQRWSGLILPGSGRYVVPGALSPLDVDVDADVGRCVEPAIWVRHR